MVFENVGTNYPTYSPSAWNFNYDSSQFVHLVHTEPSSSNMEDHLVRAVQRNAGGIYVTNDALSNPWDSLPSYWQAEVNAIAEINDSFLAGDFNEDGGVDGDDLANWRSGFGQTSGVAHKNGDADGDGDTDGADFLAWQQQFGSDLPGLSVLASVPEPSALVLLWLAGCRWILVRPRHR